MSAEPYPQIRALSVICLHLLFRKAIPEFPGSTRSSPSYWVHVSLSSSGPLQPGFGIFFPRKVRWDIWQYVVIPVITGISVYDTGVEVFQGLDGTGRNWNNLYAARNQDFEQILNKIQSSLEKEMVARRFVPSNLFG